MFLSLQRYKFEGLSLVAHGLVQIASPAEETGLDKALEVICTAGSHYRFSHSSYRPGADASRRLWSAQRRSLCGQPCLYPWKPSPPAGSIAEEEGLELGVPPLAPGCAPGQRFPISHLCVQARQQETHPAQRRGLVGSWALGARQHQGQS